MPNTLKQVSKTNIIEADAAGYATTRRTLCAGIAATLALPFLNTRARASSLDQLVLFGPPAGPSITLAYAVGKGLLRNVADKVEFRSGARPMKCGRPVVRFDEALVMPTTTAANLHTRGLGLKLASVMTNGLLYIVSRNDRSRLSPISKVKV